jgi:hypothetical protein
MTEFERIRSSVPVLQTDEAAKARARARLMEAVAAESDTAVVSTQTRSRTRRPALLIGVAAAIGLMVFLAQALLPSHHGGPNTSAATELRRLAPLAANIPAIEPGDGYVYSKVEEVDVQNASDLSTGTTYDLLVREQLETWVAADGSGRQVTTYQDVSFASAADQAAWVKAGRPDLPKVGEPVVASYGPGGLPVFDVGALPTDPAALEQAIHAGDVMKVPPGDLGTFTAITQLLADPSTPPDLRRGLFELAAQTPGVEFEPSVTDPLGRSGEGFTYQVGTARQTVIVDPATAALLARVTVDDQGLTTWQAPLQQAAVSSRGDRP